MTAQGDRKVYAFGDEAQAKIAEGIRKGAEMVESTLGPAGSNVLIERKHRPPHVVDDGYTAINQLILEDDLENLGANSLVDAANKASENAGDGTSTTITLTSAIYEAGRKLAGTMGFGKTPIEIKNTIFEARDLVLAKLKKASKKIKTRDEIRQVAIAAYADEKMADTVADLIFQVGENGIVIVEEGWGRDTEVEVVTGMRFAGKLAHGFFANTPDDGLSLEGLPVLVTDYDFVNLNDIAPLVKEVSALGEQGLIIVANKYERAAIEQIVRVNTFNIQNRNPFKIYLIKTPSFTPGEFEDLAVYVGGRYLSKERGDKVLEAKHTQEYSDLGRASEFRISVAGDGIAIGGAGKKESVDARIEILKQKLAAEKVKMLKGRVKQRIASLASAIGIIKVASPSEAETEHRRLKTKNAVRSCQAAVEEGVVTGGGLALKDISDELKDDNILKEAIKRPYEVIQRNAGGKLDIPDIYDALKVIRTALEQACSQAWLLINTKTIIAFRTEPDRLDVVKYRVEKTKNEDNN